MCGCDSALLCGGKCVCVGLGSKLSWSEKFHGIITLHDARQMYRVLQTKANTSSSVSVRSIQFLLVCHCNVHIFLSGRATGEGRIYHYCHEDSGRWRCASIFLYDVQVLARRGAAAIVSRKWIKDCGQQGFWIPIFGSKYARMSSSINTFCAQSSAVQNS